MHYLRVYSVAFDPCLHILLFALPCVFLLVFFLPSSRCN